MGAGEPTKLNRIRGMTTRKKDVPAKKKSTSRKKGKPSLKMPRWHFWIARGKVNFLQAALLSMGLSPAPGVVGLLRAKPRRMAELRKRQKDHAESYGLNDWLPRGSTLPKTVTIRGLLEFASEKRWELSKNVRNALERMRHLAPLDVAAGSEGAKEQVAYVPTAEIEPIPLTTEGDVNTFTVNRDRRGEESLDRKDRRLQQILGAALILLERAAKNGISKEYLRGERLNVSAVANDIIGTIGGGAELKHSLAGLSERNISVYLSEAIQPYRHSDS